jgi:hypothetical protein
LNIDLMFDTLSPSSVPSSEPSFDPSYVPSLKHISISSPVPSTEPSFKPSTAPSSELILFVTMFTFARHFNVLLSISEPSFVSSEESHPTLKSNIVPSLEPSLRSKTALSSPVPSSIPSSNICPSLKSSLEMSYLHASMKPSWEPSTASVAATYNDDGPTKAIIFSSYHNLRLPVGTEIFILSFAAPISALNELIIFVITVITFAQHFNFLSSAETSFGLTFISSEQAGPILVSSSLSSTIPSLETSSISTYTTVQSSLSTNVPSLDISMMSSTTIRSSPILSSVPSSNLRFCLKSSLVSSTVSVAATDVDDDDGPTKAIIFSSCHNLRLPVGMEIFILLLDPHNSEPSAAPSSVPSAIPCMEPSLKPSTALISAPNEITIFFLTCLSRIRE